MGDFRTKERYYRTITRLRIQKIDIECIQGAHNVDTTVYEANGYKIFFSPSGKADDANPSKKQIETGKHKGRKIKIREREGRQ